MQYDQTVYDAFMLMAGATIAVRKKMDALLKTVDLTFPQFGALMALEEHTLITQTELAQQLGTDTTTSMVICDSLQKKALLRRVPDAHDRRVNRLESTDEGRAALERAKPLILGYYEPIIAALKPEEWETLRDLAGRVVGKVKE